MKTIMVNLCGVFHSYGYENDFEYGQRFHEPTKSSIAEMIARAGGIPKNDPRTKEIADSITIESKAYELPQFIGDLREKKTPPNIITDKLLSGETIDYIADVYFRVWISGEDEKIKQYSLWLDDPERWLYLGEESCIPSWPIFLMEENKHVFDIES